MSDARAILAYAQPGGSAGTNGEPDATVFTFASPPPRTEKITLILLFIACAVGAVIIVGLAYHEYVNDRRERVVTLGIAAFGLLVIAGVLIVGVREWVRVWRFGQRDVRLEVRGRKLLAWAPQSWGAEPRAVDVEQIRRVVVKGTGLNASGVRLFEIKIRRRGWFAFTWEIRVAVADRGVVNRSIADLNAAIERAKVSAPGRAGDGTGAR